QACWILAVRCCLFGRIAGSDMFTGLVSAAQAIVPRRRQPIGQDCERLPAQPTDSAPHPHAGTPVIVTLTQAPAVANDRVVPASWTPPRQQFQRDYPGSMLSFTSGSAIKRITAGLKARR